MQNEMRDRLVKLLGNRCCSKQIPCEICEYQNFGDCHKYALADHLIENGVIVPPCKVGDVVYCIEHKTIRECIVTLVKMLTYDNKTVFFVEAECEIVSPFYSDGRIIKHGLSAVWKIEYGSWYRAFPTKEEAEKALKKSADNG